MSHIKDARLLLVKTKSYLVQEGTVLNLGARHCVLNQYVAVMTGKCLDVMKKNVDCMDTNENSSASQWRLKGDEKVLD